MSYQKTFCFSEVKIHTRPPTIRYRTFCSLYLKLGFRSLFLSGFACGDEKPIVDDYLQGADFSNESNFSSADFEDKTRPKYKTNPGGLPPHVKEAIKSKYEAGVTRPKEIINSLIKDGIMEHDSFPMNKFYNHIKEMKRKMSGKRRKRRLKLAIGGLEM